MSKETLHGQELLDTENPAGRAKEIAISFNVELSNLIQGLVDKLHAADRKSRERSLAITDLQMAAMWLEADCRVMLKVDEK